jgi:flagellar basal-body rod protein FlgG
MLETSNVNPVEEMTKLIQANRAFEQGLKSMKVYDDIMSKESAQIGRLQ